MKNLLRPALSLFALLTVVTGVARLAFPEAAGGSLIVKDGQAVGSRLIGQNFSDPKYFWGRPSATAPQPYNASASSGSNQGPLNPALVDAVKARRDALLAAEPGNTRPIPADLVSASASGLDPQISLPATDYQLARVARARGLDPDIIKAVVARYTEGRQWGIFGEPRINVLELNLALDSLTL